MKKNVLQTFRQFISKISKCLISFLLIIGISGCEEPIEEKELVFELDKTALVFDFEGGSQSIAISSNGEWIISGEADWFTVSPRYGEGNETVTVTVSENETLEERETTLTFRSGEKTITVEISQTDNPIFETGFLEIDWETSEIISYDENSGTITIQFQGTPPAFEANRAIVLPREYEYDIRVITSSAVSGNTATLETEQGDMTNLFMDISFTLSTDPSQTNTRSAGGNRVITPSKIMIMTENGYQTIYEKGSTLRSTANYETSFNIFSFQRDFSGTELFNAGAHRAYWARNTFDIGLVGTFEFDFGSEMVNRIRIGNFRSFAFWLDGHFNMDLLLNYVFTATANFERSGTVIENVIPSMTFKWMVGVVPVYIVVSTDLNYEVSASAESQITASVGCTMSANIRAGLRHTRGVGTSPITGFTSNFTMHQPTLSFFENCVLEAKATVYPQINFGIYRFLHPHVSLKPYLGADIMIGRRQGGGLLNYMIGEHTVSTGVDLGLGLDIRFARFERTLWSPDDFNLIDRPLFQAPAKIELVSPENGTEIRVNNPIEVRFQVSSFNRLTGNYSPTSWGAPVNFETQGTVSNEFVQADANGIVAVQWTPTSTTDRLTARLIDRNGQTISEVVFTPEIEAECPCANNPGGVAINGVCWATRNLATHGTFVQNPEDFGGLFQWGRRGDGHERRNSPTTTTLSTSDVPGHGNFIIFSWENNWSLDWRSPSDDNLWGNPKTANDPCPQGWRVPTDAELLMLTNTTNVSSQWTTVNGVNGRTFTDRNTGNNIFLPAAGWRNSTGTLDSVGTNNGNYWSSTPAAGTTARFLWFGSTGVNVGINYRVYGMSVRCVAD